MKKYLFNCGATRTTGATTRGGETIHCHLVFVITIMIIVASVIGVMNIVFINNININQSPH